MERHKL